MVRAAVDNDGGDANEATTPEVRKIHNTTEEDPIRPSLAFLGEEACIFFSRLLLALCSVLQPLAS
jgi:hypothetical protein